MFKHSKSKDMAPGSKRYLFYSILLLLPLLFFILLETALHLFNYGGDLSLFVPAPKEYHDHLMCNPKIGQRYFFRQNTVSRTPNDYFLTQKPPDCYRIFVLGASTAAGFPYGDGLMFSRILRRRLQDTFPERTIEVVNTAMTAVNSYTLWDILDEIIKQKPDVLLIYAGHNEFYGALGVASLESFGRKSWFVHLYLKLQRFKTVILVRNGMNVFSRWFTKNEPAKLTATLMERIVGQEEIPYESTLYHQGIAQYETNLSLILQKSKQAGIPLIISELVCNLRDQPPFVAQDTSASSEAWRLYRQAQDLERQNRFNEAKRKYLTAKDLDPVRFRAPEAFNAIIHKLAQQHAVPVVPMQKYFEEHSPNGLIGRELMIDHLHPNIDGYFLMADAFFQTLRYNQFIAAVWRDSYIKPSSYYRTNWGITGLDTAYVDLLIHHLKAGWPFKPKTAENTVLKNFKPRTMVDTLVARIIYDELNLAQAHLQLANYYRTKKNLLKAEQEYQALFQILNEDDMAYLNRADILIAHHEHAQALRLLYKSIEIHETPLALKRIGQIHLDFGRTKEAVPFLERAHTLMPDDMHLLYLLAKSYSATGQIKSAQQALNTLKSHDPFYQGIPVLENLLSQAK